MKLLIPGKLLLGSTVLITVFCSCERTTRTETTTVTDRDKNDTVTVARRTTTAEEDLNNFRAWVRQKTNRADSSARQNWPEVKEEFRTKTNQMETRLDSLSAESKREYEDLKADYKRWELKNERRQNMPLDAAKLAAFRKTLLGSYSDLKTITPANAQEVYQSFLRVIRGKKDTWSPDDWDYVDHVYGELNDRKSEFENNISTGDRLKIKALQTEYLGFEAAADTKDAYKNLRDH